MNFKNENLKYLAISVSVFIVTIFSLEMIFGRLLNNEDTPTPASIQKEVITYKNNNIVDSNDIVVVDKNPEVVSSAKKSLLEDNYSQYDFNTSKSNGYDYFYDYRKSEHYANTEVHKLIQSKDSYLNKVIGDFSEKTRLPILIYDSFDLDSYRFGFFEQVGPDTESNLNKYFKTFKDEVQSRKPGSKNSYGLPLKDSRVRDYIITGYFNFRDSKNGYICGVKAGDDFIKDLYSQSTNKLKVSQNLFIVIHELSHCIVLTNRKRMSEFNLEVDIIGNAVPNLVIKDYDSALAQTYAIHINESLADVMALMYAYFEMDLSVQEFKLFSQAAYDYRRDHAVNHFTELGHFTKFYVEPIRDDHRNLDRFKELYKEDPISAALSYLKDYGNEFTINYDLFEKLFLNMAEDVKGFINYKPIK